MNQVTDILTYAFLVGGILVLTRPGSQGPKFVSALGGAFTGLVQGSTGQNVTTIK